VPAVCPEIAAGLSEKARQAENDYAVSCTDENEYRVYLNDAGRVVVEKRK